MLWGYAGIACQYILRSVDIPLDCKLHVRRPCILLYLFYSAQSTLSVHNKYLAMIPDLHGLASEFLLFLKFTTVNMDVKAMQLYFLLLLFNIVMIK